MRYDAAGNVTKIVDGVNSETVDYTYDDLDRLLTASAPAGESFVYDKIGNLTSKSGTALSYGTTAPKHGVKTHGTTTYTYDANGSMTARGTQTIKYDPEHRPIRIQDGNAVSRASYDGDGVRRKRMDSNGTVHYLGGYERKLAADVNSSDTITKYYSASLGAMSRPVAFRRGGTLHWVGADHLGGTIRVLNSSFTALDGMRYKPYGEDRDTGSSLNTDRKFTGQTEDEAAGLYWYASRAYDPAIGRFVSPDVLVPEPGNPQALNRYSYVYNNPLKFVDPTGLTPGAGGWDEAWAREFARHHNGKQPGTADWRDYQFSLTNPGSGPGGSWTDQDWVNYHNTGTPKPTPAPAPQPQPNIEDHKANLAENYNPTIVLADQAREADLAESYSSTIRPRDPSPVPMDTGQAESIIFNVSVEAFEKFVDKAGRTYGIPKEGVQFLKSTGKAVKPIGSAVDFVSTYSEERRRGGSEVRALVVAGTQLGSTALFAWGGTVMAGPPGTIAAGYFGGEFGKEAGPIVADFLGL